jgi:predicted Zn-dependent peptidase
MKILSKLSHKVYLTFLFCVVFLVATGNLHRAYADTDTARRLMTEMLSRVHFYRLENGLRVILYRRGIAPVFSGVVSVKVGGSDELQGHTGISHLLEHMAFKGTETIGTKDYGREKKLLSELEQIAHASEGATSFTAEQKQRWQELDRELQALWINNDFFGQYEARGASQMNATTSADSTDYFNSFPRAAFEFWCQMESDRIKSPVMRQFYQERDVVMEERRSRFDDSPEGKLYEQLLSVSYSFHPYRNPVIGYETDLKKVTADQVAAFHQRHYVPENIVITLVGDIVPERDIEIVRRYFGSIKKGTPPPRLAYQEPAQVGERRVALELAAAPTVLIGYHKPAYPHPDDPRIALMAEILAGGAISPLYETLVKKQRIAASVGVEEAPGTLHPSLLVFSLTPKSPHSGDDLLKAFDRVIAQFIQKPIDQESLDRAKRASAVSFIKQMRSNLGLAKDLANSELLFGDWKATLQWFEELMAVRSEDVSKVAREYLKNSNRTVAQIIQKEAAR